MWAPVRDWLELFQILELDYELPPDYKQFSLTNRHTCPSCKDRCVRFIDDHLYRDGWYFCEKCGNSGHALLYVAQTLNITNTEAAALYTNKDYAIKALISIETWDRYHNACQKVGQKSDFSSILNILDKLKLPRANTTDWLSRVTPYIRTTSKTELYELKLTNSYDIRWRGNVKWQDTGSSNRSYGLCAICTDYINRVTGYLLIGPNNAISHVVTLPVIPNMLRVNSNQVGFLFGNALWNNMYADLFENTIFVLPLLDTISIQLEHLRDYSGLLPVVAHHYDPNCSWSSQTLASRTIRTELFESHIWDAWLGKKFIFCTNQITPILLILLKMTDGFLYHGDIPTIEQDMLPINRLIYMHERAGYWKYTLAKFFPQEYEEMANYTMADAWRQLVT